MRPVIPAEKAKRDFEALLNKADRSTGVWIRRGQSLYHIRREISEDEAAARLQISLREVKTGKAKTLDSLADLD